MSINSGITFDVLRKLVVYDQESGRLFWLHRPRDMFERDGDFNGWNAKHQNKEAFTATNRGGYKVGYIFNRMYYAHRVVWALFHGEWPSQDIDHIDGNRSDNRILNLREVSRSYNLRNARMQSTNTSGHNGVHWSARRNKWVAQIVINKKYKFIGHFDDLISAIQARKLSEVGHGFTERHGK